MPDDEAVKAVAKAISESGTGGYEFGSLDARDCARIAIDALREMGWGPTDERVNAWLLLTERLLAAVGKEDEAMEVRQYRIKDAQQRSND